MKRRRRSRASPHRRGGGRGAARGRQRGRRRGRAVLASFAVESPLTGFGAGGYMMVHRRRGDDADRLLRRRARARRDRARGRAGAGAGPLRRRDGADVLRRPRLLRGAGDGRRAGAGAASASARCRSPIWSGPGSGSPARARRSTPSRPTSSRSSRRSTSGWRDARALRAARGGRWARATSSASPSWPRRWNASAPRAPSPSTAARSRAAISDFVVERGGTLGPGDLASYEAIERRPIRRRSAAPRC